MRILIWLCSVLLLILNNAFLVGVANALSLTYSYEGNNFVEFEGDPDVFSTSDKVIGQFRLDCTLANAEGDCRNLPYADYAALGAVYIAPLGFTAGPAGLPTSEGSVDINRFFFSTTSNAQILDWDIDLTFVNQAGFINLDTDNVGDGLDSAFALEGGAFVTGEPGTWEIFSSEPTATAEEAKSIARLYSAAFDREPKAVGLNFWIESYESGLSLVDIAKRFHTSPEFNLKYGLLNDTEYVEQLFLNVLGRKGVASGINFWVRHLREGVSRARVLAQFSDSPENIKKTNELFANMQEAHGWWTFAPGQAGQASTLTASGYQQVGEGTSCVIDRSGVRCWGQLGQSAVPKDLINPYYVDASRHICALDDAGVHCWGYNAYGQTDVPDDLVDPYSVSVGEDFTCVLDLPGARCWGNNYMGQTDVPRLINPSQVSSQEHSCAIDDTGVVCWGGLNHFGEATVPRGLVNPRQVEVSLANTCVLDDIGVHCWGHDLTDPPFQTVNPIDIAVGLEFACVLDDLGVRCWGDVPGAPMHQLVSPREISAGRNHWCVLDDIGVHCRTRDHNLYGESSIPKNLVNPREVRAGTRYSCAIDDLGIVCWGPGRNYGHNTTVPNARQLAIGPYHGCAIGDEGVSCWGSDQFGQRSVPPGLVNPVELSVGAWHSCAIDDSGVHCWGGWLPYFPNEPPSDLVSPHGLTAEVANCVIDYGIVKCWGMGSQKNPAPKPENQHYVNPRQIDLGWGGLCVLDDNGVQCTQRQSEVPKDLEDPYAISTEGNACALDAKGVKCWGPNEFGQSNPPKGLVNPRQISVGRTHACVLDDTGVHCWGSGEGSAAEIPTDLKF